MDHRFIIPFPLFFSFLSLSLIHRESLDLRRRAVKFQRVVGMTMPMI